jgi:hypothetical protein
MGCGDLSPAAIIVDQYGNIVVSASTVDAFGRLRVSNPQTLFDSKQVFDNGSLDFLTSLASGGTAVWVQARASTILTVTPAVGSQAVRQSKRYFNYQPGKSTQVIMTFVPNAQDPTVRRRTGLIDPNNGVCFQQSGAGLAFVVRSSVSGAPVDTVIPRSAWNRDKLDGTGPRGVVFDSTMIQVFMTDMEWLGGGPVRFYFVTSAGITLCHVENNENVLPSVYMSTPNLPVRWEIERVAGGGAGDANLEAICCTVVSEGGQQEIGGVFGIDREITPISAPNTHLVPVLAIRLKAAQIRRTVKPLQFQIFSPAAADSSLFRLLINPTRGVGTAPSWLSAHAQSAVEYDVTSTQVITGGQILFPGYAQGRTIVLAQGLPTQFVLGAQDMGGTIPDELVIAARATTGSNNVFGAISWVEL